MCMIGQINHWQPTTERPKCEVHKIQLVLNASIYAPPHTVIHEAAAPENGHTPIVDLDRSEAGGRQP